MLNILLKRVFVHEKELSIDFLNDTDFNILSVSFFCYVIYSEDKIGQTVSDQFKNLPTTNTGRQVRFTFKEVHFKVELVFYNRLLTYPLSIASFIIFIKYL